MPDTKLVMYNVVVCIVGEASARIKMLRCVRHFYEKPELTALYKSHVTSFIESCIPAYYHAAPSILNLIDEVQSDFLESISISKIDVFMNFNLEPLCLRRDVQMLGILYKVVLGIAPIPLHNLPDLRHFGLHVETKLHNKQLYDPAGTK